MITTGTNAVIINRTSVKFDINFIGLLKDDSGHSFSL